MDLIDSIKRRLGSFLPGRHRIALLGLIGFLIVITHDAEYSGTVLTPRHPAALLAETRSPASPATVLEAMVHAPTSSTSPGSTEAEFAEASFTGEALTVTTPIVPEESKAHFVTEVKSGDNLSLIFDRAGLTAQDVYRVGSSEPKADILTNLYPGYRLEFFLDDEKQLDSLTITRNPLQSVVFNRNEANGFSSKEITRTPEIKQVYREATIDDSLFLAAQRGEISASITMELAGIFGGVIDFLLDTRRGDTFSLMYEEKYIDGEYIGNGAILAAQFTNQGETFTAVRYVSGNGDVDFFNPDGESMRKAFLRNPVDFTRISSNFSLSRKHPILNTIRAHKGTDYAAPRGTPVVAAGDGRVTWASRNGSFGKLVVVQHGGRFQTKYAHLTDYARGVKNGARVKQGQVIGYVGSTGGATGPHLHYEFLMDGVHRNARTIHDQLPKAESVPGPEMQRFKEQTQILISQLEVHASNTKNIAQHTVTPEP